MKHIRCVILITCLTLVLLATAAFAGIAETINYQGRLENSGGIPIDGTVSMTFAIYNTPSGGVALWTETQSSVTVTAGAFSVVLGSLVSLTTLPFDEQYYLGVTVGGDAEMEPRAVLVSVPYSMRAYDADMLDGQHSSEIIDAASDEVRTPISSVPFTIDSPGSYYLTDDLYITGGSAITVNSNYVTIDLMGFSLNGGGAAQYGIYINGMSNVEIRNGTIRGFGTSGINEETSSGKGHRVINIRAIGNGTGIYLRGDDQGAGHLVKDCTVLDNGTGIDVSKGSTVTGNIVRNNVYFGIIAAQGTSVTGNTVSNNGMDGILANRGSTVTGNTVFFNQWNGINLVDDCLVDGNTAYDNDQSAGGNANISACATCTFGTNHAP